MSIVRSTSSASRLRDAKPGATACLVFSIVLVAVVGQGTAHAAANPTMWNQASASGLPAGSQIYDSISLGGGVNPTGTLTFTLFGPGNPTCAGPPIFTTTTAVNGNGYYESARYTTNAAGTYIWVAAYGGDAANNPPPPTPCSAPSAQVVMGKRTPVLNTSRTWVPPMSTATGVLTSGSGPTGPTGTMTFNLYGPANMTCAGAPIFSSVKPVAWNGTYVSAPYTPIAVGTYQWVVIYSGDANNNARSSTCTETANGFTVTVAPTTAVSGTPTTVARGGTITVNWSSIVAPTAYDWVALYAVGTPDGGAVSAWKFTSGTAGGSVTLKFPWGAAAGSYEIRLMANNSTRRLATSGAIIMVW
ncbi:MAG: hypothetical protein QOH36_1054 [Actinomycetota bacterium]|nr:hypothetical protein [Actinomycetota bacterium]